MATYLAGDPIREAAQLRRWVPVEPLRRPAPTVVEREVAGWTGRDRPGCPNLTR